MPRITRIGDKQDWIQTGVCPVGDRLVVRTLLADCVRCDVPLRPGDEVWPAFGRGREAAARSKPPLEWRHVTCDPVALDGARMRKQAANDEKQRSAAAKKAARRFTSGGTLTVSVAEGSVHRVRPYRRIEIRPKVKATALAAREERRRRAAL